MEKTVYGDKAGEKADVDFHPLFRDILQTA